MDFSVGSSRKAVDVRRGISTGQVNMTIYFYLPIYRAKYLYSDAHVRHLSTINVNSCP